MGVIHALLTRRRRRAVPRSERVGARCIFTGGALLGLTFLFAAELPVSIPPVAFFVATVRSMTGAVLLHWAATLTVASPAWHASLPRDGEI
jgi:hypothetical protein